MEKLASDIATRMWTFLSQYPLMSSSEASNLIKEKIRLLNNLSLFERDIIDIEALLTSWDDIAIASSFYRFNKFVNQFDNLFVKNFERFNKKFPTSPVEEEKQPENNEINLSYIKKDIGYVSVIKEVLEQQGINTEEITSLWKELITLEDESAIDKYNMLLSKVNELANTKLKSLSEISETLLKLNQEKKSNLHPELQKLARKRIQRFLNKMRLNVSRDVESKRILQIASLLNDLSKNMDNLEDYFEDRSKNIDILAIRYFVKVIYGGISMICIEFSNLAKDYNNMVGESNLNSKKKFNIIRITDINLLERRSKYFEEQSGTL